MRIAALALLGNTDWPDVSVGRLDPGLNVFHGPPASGKTAVADLIAHALCGRRIAPPETAGPPHAPEGELVVESRERRYRLRRCHDGANADRLTVAALDGTVVDRDTVHQLVYGLSPSLLAPMYVVNFREPLRLEWLLSDGFAQEFRAAFSRRRWNGCRRASDFLAQLTDGDLLRLQLRRRARGALVVNRAGDAISVNSISSSERDQVYLSLCLALISAIARHGVELPLVLDEPFVRLDRRSSLALAAVLADFSQRGQQVLVFTARQEVAERFAALGATVHDMLVLQQRRVEPALAVVSEAKMQAAQETVRATGRTAGAARRKRRQAG